MFRYRVVLVVVFMACANKLDVGSSFALAEVGDVNRTSSVETRADDGWRHTASGWQRWGNGQWDTGEYKPAGPQSVARLHPLLIAALQLLTTLFALIWFDGTSDPKKKQADSTTLYGFHLAGAPSPGLSWFRHRGEKPRSRKYLLSTTIPKRFMK